MGLAGWGILQILIRRSAIFCTYVAYHMPVTATADQCITLNLHAALLLCLSLQAILFDCLGVYYMDFDVGPQKLGIDRPCIYYVHPAAVNEAYITVPLFRHLLI